MSLSLKYLSHLEAKKREGLYRETRVSELDPSRSFCSNDYLGLSNHQQLVDGLREADSVGACSSRLVGGTLPVHLELEDRLASFLGKESALLFGAGYLANIGVISSLVSRKDVVFSDKAVHASLIDGIRLSQADHYRFNHNSLDQLSTFLKRERKSRKDVARFFIVVESVYSMDGDRADISELSRLAKQYNALLIVDEAHALGVFGKGGSGCCVEVGIDDPDIVVLGTLSKAIGAYGGFAAGGGWLREYLVNTSRPFIYNTALPGGIAQAALGALKVLDQEKKLGQELLSRANVFRELLSAAGLNTLQSTSQIVPLIVGDADKAIELSKRLEEDGVRAIAIRPPTVPSGTSRLRFSVTLVHKTEDLEEIAKLVIAHSREMKII